MISRKACNELCVESFGAHPSSFHTTPGNLSAPSPHTHRKSLSSSGFQNNILSCFSSPLSDCPCLVLTAAFPPLS